MRRKKRVKDLTTNNLNKRNVTTKERLCQWLGAVVHIMDRFAIKHMNTATYNQEKLKDQLTKEKDNFTKLKSELQSKVIEKREEELSLLTTAAQKEMK